jgi:hypothetical protein
MSTTETRDQSTTTTPQRRDYHPVVQMQASTVPPDSHSYLSQNMVVLPYTGRDRVFIVYDADAERRKSLRREIRDLLAR